MSDYILCHHGIKGQKWGVRRFQKKDGSLTPAGKKRYLENFGVRIDGAITNPKRPTVPGMRVDGAITNPKRPTVPGMKAAGAITNPKRPTVPGMSKLLNKKLDDYKESQKQKGKEFINELIFGPKKERYPWDEKLPDLRSEDYPWNEKPSKNKDKYNI